MRRLHWILSITALAVAGLVSVAVAARPPADASTGSAQVFAPNPVQSTGITTLTDQKDADAAVPASAYRRVTLTDLDGSGFLRGAWATVVSETGNPAYSPTNTFMFTRRQDEFEQVMAYYWVTESQRYIQRLGFGSTRPAINKTSQAVRINQWGLDNSFMTDHPKDELRFGKGGVDDAEDGEVILHEYGHAIQNAQVPGFGSTLEAGSIGEGFGDYWALTVGDLVAGAGPRRDLPCIADWDSVSYTAGPVHCLRRTDEDKLYPQDVVGEVHADGELWSRALWDIRQAVGATRADTLILNAHFAMSADTTFAAAAGATIASASALYGAPVANAVRASFVARGFIG